MSDTLIVALIGAFAVVSASAVPSLIGLSNRRQLIAAAAHAAAAKDTAAEVASVAQDLADSLGPKNGKGDLMAMVSHVLEDQAQIIRWQKAHESDDVSRFGHLLEKNVELTEYTHNRMHDVLQLLTGTKGKTDLMWLEYEKRMERSK